MTSDTKPLISFCKATVANGEEPVIHDLDMDIYPGDFAYITGKVGTGKTSIIRTIIAENKLFKGRAEVCGHQLHDIRDKEISPLRRKLGVVFQDFQLLMDMNVRENLEFVLNSTGWKDKDAIYHRICEVLSAVGMSTKMHKMPFQLSGGEQQRIAIARALLNNPAVIIADEPTGNLDNQTTKGIMNLLYGINKNTGTAIVMVTHNTTIVENFPGRVFVCENETCKEIQATV